MSKVTSTHEVVIVGGGIYGTSLAYELASRGRDVLLLEGGEIAGGRLGRSWGARCARQQSRYP